MRGAMEGAAAATATGGLASMPLTMGPMYEMLDRAPLAVAGLPVPCTLHKQQICIAAGGCIQGVWEL